MQNSGTTCSRQQCVAVLKQESDLWLQLLNVVPAGRGAALEAEAGRGIGAVKRALPDTVSYGQIKVVAALRHVGGSWFGGGPPGGSGGEGAHSSQPPPPQHAAQSQADPSAAQVKVQLIFVSPPRPHSLGPSKCPAQAADIATRTCHLQAPAAKSTSMKVCREFLHIRPRTLAVGHIGEYAASTTLADYVNGCTS